MQDFKQFDYIIDFDGIIKAIENGQKVDIIINGEFYELKTKEEVKKMGKEDMINKCEKVVFDTCSNSVYFIIQTVGDDDFWWWQVQKNEIQDYFLNNSSALYELAQEKLSKNHCEQFINDIKNEFLGCSCGSFETVKQALNDIWLS